MLSIQIGHSYFHILDPLEISILYLHPSLLSILLTWNAWSLYEKGECLKSKVQKNSSFPRGPSRPFLSGADTVQKSSSDIKGKTSFSYSSIIMQMLSQVLGEPGSLRLLQISGALKTCPTLNMPCLRGNRLCQGLPEFLVWLMQWLLLHQRQLRWHGFWAFRCFEKEFFLKSRTSCFLSRASFANSL